jgi:hypothetical protein
MVQGPEELVQIYEMGMAVVALPFFSWFELESTSLDT